MSSLAPRWSALTISTHCCSPTERSATWRRGRGRCRSARTDLDTAACGCELQAKELPVPTAMFSAPRSAARAQNAGGPCRCRREWHRAATAGRAAHHRLLCAPHPAGRGRKGRMKTGWICRRRSRQEGMELAGLDLERDIVIGDKRPETLGQMLDRQSGAPGTAPDGPPATPVRRLAASDWRRGWRRCEHRSVGLCFLQIQLDLLLAALDGVGGRFDVSHHIRWESLSRRD